VRGRGRGVAAGDGSQVRGERQLRDQAEQRWRRRATVQPDRIGGWKRPKLAAHAARVRLWWQQNPT
jgi:hypothetical protein